MNFHLHVCLKDTPVTIKNNKKIDKLSSKYGAGLYLITFISNDNKLYHYVGQTIDLYDRLRSHSTKFKFQKNIKHLQELYNKSKIINYTIIKSNMKHEDLNESEAWYIQKLKESKTFNIINKNKKHLFNREEHIKKTKEGMKKYFYSKKNPIIKNNKNINSINLCYNTKYSTSLLVL